MWSSTAFHLKPLMKSDLAHKRKTESRILSSIRTDKKSKALTYYTSVHVGSDARRYLQSKVTYPNFRYPNLHLAKPPK